MKLKWIFLGVLVGATASAQMANMDMGGKSLASGSDSKFMQEMNVSMSKMDHDMAAAPMTGDPDHDFVTMMIPHHQGAIDMAKGELSYGTDPALRHLAQQIVLDQKSEIDLMNRWLKKHAEAKAKAEK